MLKRLGYIIRGRNPVRTRDHIWVVWSIKWLELFGQENQRWKVDLIGFLGVREDV